MPYLKFKNKVDEFISMKIFKLENFPQVNHFTKQGHLILQLHLY